ncbi:MAG TPA: 30S ribosomal protein S13 [Candidatus Moranbacteria bacterium]|nr:30S ribosomal protein S13 [Candidatus Moranbacteria bacterium]
MVRIAGINLPDEKCIEVALTYVYGVGPATSKRILEKLGIEKAMKTKALSAQQADKLREEIEKNYTVEGELKHEVKMNVKRLKEIGCYRGTRHQRGLPVHGQRTKTNSRTVRGNVRRTMGSGRRSESKT